MGEWMSGWYWDWLKICSLFELQRWYVRWVGGPFLFMLCGRQIVGCYLPLSFIPSNILGVAMATSAAARCCCFLLAWHGVQILSREWISKGCGEM